MRKSKLCRNHIRKCEEKNTESYNRFWSHRDKLLFYKYIKTSIIANII
jgi:hypothetical protein